MAQYFTGVPTTVLLHNCPPATRSVCLITGSQTPARQTTDNPLRTVQKHWLYTLASPLAEENNTHTFLITPLICLVRRRCWHSVNMTTCGHWGIFAATVSQYQWQADTFFGPVWSKFGVNLMVWNRIFTTLPRWLGGQRLRHQAHVLAFTGPSVCATNDLECLLPARLSPGWHTPWLEVINAPTSGGGNSLVPS